ncbi:MULTISPECIES: hypothetical protein [Pseudomonas]|uniref:Uncharacterized protein n=1 Tax=Pseudomonas fluorescens (strain Pf0-1) TaxID=205922 RepID=Q3KJX7_PSEPF|nr:MULTISPECIES: hypothetical protein [Pseudomonas]ABA71929.1 conserved hypothetical protein [Pseudomonas fluorescens Pf0-1]MBL0795930.1 hypothetical protein [Pseudomonas sp. B7]MBX8624055.1 hypothetical protein [Pseudomonas glycinae]MBY9023413.1 hypothetical protein [Pseudomonas fluorescens]MBY9029405.1 hypothetical protein [Pseudomonas fluorescens]
MTDARPTPEEQVLKHVREQHNAEPPAHLDALILNAARHETPAPRQSLWQRWLKACQQPRYQVAFASLVGIALMLSLVQRAPEPVAQFDFAPAAKPAAPVARSLSAPAGALSAPAPAMAPAPMAEMAAPMQSESIRADTLDEAKVSKRAAAPVNGLDEQLREVLRLRESGQSQAADSLFSNLHKRYPNVNLDLRLEKIRKN